MGCAGSTVTKWASWSRISSRSSFISQVGLSRTMKKEMIHESRFAPGACATRLRVLMGNESVAGIRRAKSLSGAPLLAPRTGVPAVQRHLGHERALHRRSADAGQWRGSEPRAAGSGALSRDLYRRLGVPERRLRQRR